MPSTTPSPTRPRDRRPVQSNRARRRNGHVSHQAPQSPKRRSNRCGRRSDRVAGLLAQPGGPHGSLERRSLEDRDLRLARLRRRRLRDRRRSRDEAHRSQYVRPGRVRPCRSDSRRRLQAARGREHPHPERLAGRARSRFHRGDRGRRRGSLEAGGRPERPLAARSGPRRPDLGERTGRARRARDPRGQGHSARQDRARPRSGRRGPAGPPRPLHRPVRRRELGPCRRHALRRGPGEGRTLLSSGHPRHPRDRVRRAGGGGHPPVARADGGRRDVRAGRASQPGDAGVGGSRGGSAPGRARRRRRLLDVLLEAGTRRASCRTQ